MPHPATLTEHPRPPALLTGLFEQLPGSWGCKDAKSRFVYVNHAYAQLVGLSTPADLIGKSDADLPGALSGCAAEFQRQDQLVLQSGKPLRVLNIHPYPDGTWHAHVFTKIPWQDEQGNIIGTLFSGQPLNDNPMLEVGQWLCRAFGGTQQSKLPFTATSKTISLSSRESEVLFFHLFGKKPQFIANALNVSVKTIENHFANLRVKLGAASKADLVDKALEHRVGCKIPNSLLLNRQLTLVISGDQA